MHTAECPPDGQLLFDESILELNGRITLPQCRTSRRRCSGRQRKRGQRRASIDQWNAGVRVVGSHFGLQLGTVVSLQRGKAVLRGLAVVQEVGATLAILVRTRRVIGRCLNIGVMMRMRIGWCSAGLHGRARAGDVRKYERGGDDDSE